LACTKNVQNVHGDVRINLSRYQNTEFLNCVTAAYEKSQWKKLSQCFHRASLMDMNKIKQLEASKSSEKNRYLHHDGSKHRHPCANYHCHCKTNNARCLFLSIL